MAVRMRGARRRVKGRYCRKGGEAGDQILYTNSQKCYLMNIFWMAGRMRGVSRKVKGRYSRKGERRETSVFK